jgi:glycosyltransferase involved in cell wall biosynthesis
MGNPEPRVLFVSKPIVAPWNDGSKNLVRDVAASLELARPTVMVSPGAAEVAPRVRLEPVYRDAGRFAPGLVANARVAGRLLAGDPHDVWHFVFAPNPRSSTVARVARAARRAAGWKGAVVQTVASAPRSFDEAVRSGLFGDVVVALSEHTAGRLRDAGADPARLRVIPPCARPLAPRDGAAKAATRARLGFGDGDHPIVLYPGDYEVSRGAATVADAAKDVLAAVPEARLVFACRKKTPRADAAQREIEARIARAGKDVAARTLHLGEVADMGELLAVASLVVFPVDDLYGKVDLPLVLLEAMAMGVPLVVASGGPLDALDFAPRVTPGDGRGLAEAALPLLFDPRAREALGRAGRAAYEASYTPEAVARAYDALYAELV